MRIGSRLPALGTSPRHAFPPPVACLGTGPLAAGTLALGPAGALDTGLPRLRYEFRATGAAQADTVRVRDGGAAVLVSVDAWSGEPRASR